MEAVATAIAAELGLAVDEAVVLHASNKLTLRLRPCDVVARVAPVGEQVAAFELEIARRLADGPVAAPVDPRAHERDGVVVTFWTWYEPAGPITPAAYADALARLHAGMRTLDVPTPHFLDRVREAEEIVADRGRSPALSAAGRALLARTLTRLGRRIAERSGAEQVLHGEPHPGNLLSTTDGPRFVDLETCCRGPVEFDLAHAPDEVAAHYPGADRDLLADCRTLVLAMVTAWRWDAGDRFPDGPRLGAEGLDRLRVAVGQAG